ncbi:MAG: 30S ribosomal protein S4 [Dehalococcoidia bacterium]|nr:30S ribosomal protein S4 [Dehalococcoidia bacterium]
MGRYNGPVCRLCRRAGEKLFLKGEKCFSPKCAVDKRPTPPGQVVGRRKRLSERGIQLREKQKARWTYGLLERQMVKYYQEAKMKPGMTGKTLLQRLELRLDNTFYRLGLADSRAQARELIVQGHITVNGQKMDIPSARVNIGDVIGFVESFKKSGFYKERIKDLQRKPIPGWLSLDTTAVTGKVIAEPQISDMDTKIEDRLIVEYYSR